MTTIRVSHNRENPYTTISKYGLRHTPLKLAPRGLWSHMLSFPDDWEFNVPKLCNDLDVGKTAIYSAMDVLIKEGFMLRLQYNGKTSTGERGFQDVEYMVFEFPITPEDKMVIEDDFQRKFTQSGFPLPVNPLPENPPLLSIDVNKVMKETTTKAIVHMSKDGSKEPTLSFSSKREERKEINYFHYDRNYLKELKPSDIRSLKKYFESQEMIIENPEAWLTACVKGRWWEGQEWDENDVKLNHLISENIKDKIDEFNLNCGQGSSYFGCDNEKVWIVVNGKDTTVPKFKSPHAKFKERLRKVLVERYPNHELMLN